MRVLKSLLINWTIPLGLWLKSKFSLSLIISIIFLKLAEWTDTVVWWICHVSFHY